MNVEEALQLVFNLADQNALIREEIVGDDELTAEFIRQQEALEIVQHYIDTDLGSMMGKYTTVQIGEALELVWELGSDNVLEEEYAETDRLLRERRRQVRAVATVEDHITNHFGED